MVSYYGVDTPLKQLAVISVPEARQLLIKPFDKSCLGAMEKLFWRLIWATIRIMTERRFGLLFQH